ncbi:hypothetical protein GCM10020254_75910 [Streptomyces goshikiensis]
MRLDPLLEGGVVEQTELPVVDQLVLLALAQRLDGQPELLLGLVHRLVVEVGDPGVHPQHGLRDGEFVLARVELVVDEGAGQFGFAAVAGRHGDLGLAVLVLPLVRKRAEPLDVGVQMGRRGEHRVEVGAGEGEQGAGGGGGGGVVPRPRAVEEGVVAEAVAVREHADGELVAVLADGGLVDPAVGDQVDPARGGTPLDQHLTGAEVALDAPARERGQHLHVVEPAQHGDLAELTRDHPDVGAVLDELDAAVADGVGQPAVHPVGAALGLDPGEHPQQPAGGDLLHLRGGLGRGGEVAGGRRTQAGLPGRLQPRLRAGVHGHRAGSPS